MSLFPIDLSSTCMRGHSLSAKEILAAEKRLHDNSADAEARALLIGALPRAEQYNHIRWFAENAPSVHLGHDGVVFPDEGIEYERTRDSWLRAVRNHASDLSVASNAAWFFVHGDADAGETLYDEHLRTHPDSESVREHLAFFYECWLAINPFDNESTRGIAERALKNYWVWLDGSKKRTELLSQQFLWKMREVARRAPELGAGTLLQLADRAFAAVGNEVTAIAALAIVALAMKETAAARKHFSQLASHGESYRRVLSELARAGFAPLLRDATGIDATQAG